MTKPYATQCHAEATRLNPSGLSDDFVELKAHQNPVFELITAKIKQWLAVCTDVRRETELVNTILAGMANDGIPVIILSRWQQLWLPMAQTLLGYPAERCLVTNGQPSLGYHLLCRLLGSSAKEFSAGVLVLRHPPASHQLLLHAIHFLAVQAGIDGYSVEQQTALRRYNAWQQKGDELNELSSVDGHFLSCLQPALTREMDALAVLQHLCSTVLADSYDQAMLNDTGHA